MTASLWVFFTLLGAGVQTARNAVQRDLTARLGAIGATLVRFLFGLPFAALFLAGALWSTGTALPPLSWPFLGWTAMGALAQVGATALMLLTMERRSFVVATAYVKTEPVLVAVLGLTLLGDPLTFGMAAAILIAMMGMALLSVRPDALLGDLTSVMMGVGAAALFAIASIGFRGAILALDMPGFVVASSIALTATLALQSVVLILYLLLERRGTMAAVMTYWKPSLAAGFLGATASQFWFLAYALASAASVRTLALVEVLFAGTVSRLIFRQQTSMREAAGIALLVAGAVLIVWFHP